MSIELFEHNKKAYEKMIELLDTKGMAAVIHPTGTGKSFIAFKLAESRPKESFLWLSPSEYIFKAQLANLIEAAPDASTRNIKYMTYAKLMSLDEDAIEKMNADYIILDEFHRCGAVGWSKGVKRLLHIKATAKVIGLTATEIRFLDNHRNMAEELFGSNIASHMTLGEAIATGIIKTPIYVRAMYAYDEELEKYHKWVAEIKHKVYRNNAKHYLEKLKKNLQNANNLDELFMKYIKNVNGKYIVFCSGIKHMNAMAKQARQWFRKVNRKLEIYKVNCEEADSKKVFNEFNAASGSGLKLLFCVDMLNEGIHVSGVEGVILFRPTVSPIIYKQQIGRALSSISTKQPLIIDIVNNYENLRSVSCIQHEVNDAIKRYREDGNQDKLIMDSFEIIDESKECVKLFERLDNMLASSWDMYYELARDYFKEHGNIDIPQKYKTEDGIALGFWITTQRRVREGKASGPLDENKIKKLDELGMRWGTDEERRWNHNYKLAKAYYEKNGHLDMLLTYATPSGERLGNWISNQRKKKKASALSEARITLLEEIGMIWDKKADVHDSFYKAAVAYASEHGHCNAPQGFVTSDGLKLGVWVATQRTKKRKGCLKQEEIESLEKLSMDWGYSNGDKWNDGIKHAVCYYEEHGYVNMSKNEIMSDGFEIGKWIELQRRYYIQGILKPNRVNELDKLGMVWDVTTSWERMFKAAYDYFNENGHLRMSLQYIAPTGEHLGVWIGKQKTNRDKLSLNQIERLNSIGMDWRYINEQKWDDNFECVECFYKNHGDINHIPDNYTSERGINLSSWIRSQRSKYAKGKLTHTQIERLNSVGISWV